MTKDILGLTDGEIELFNSIEDVASEEQLKVMFKAFEGGARYCYNKGLLKGAIAALAGIGIGIGVHYGCVCIIEKMRSKKCFEALKKGFKITE